MRSLGLKPTKNSGIMIFGFWLEIILKGVMQMPNRSFKFYRKNEEEVMKSLGLKPTKNSGSGWV